MLTQEYLKSILDYNPSTGLFKWKVKMSRSIVVGSLAGCLKDKKEPYVIIKIKRKRYKAHRLAWLYHYGRWPTPLVDHKNRVKGDNWIDNLREATYKENRANNSQSPGIDLYYRKDRNVWRLRRRVGGKRVSLGHFPTKEAALLAAVNSI